MQILWKRTVSEDQNTTETVRFHKMSTTRNYAKFRYFTQSSYRCSYCFLIKRNRHNNYTKEHDTKEASWYQLWWIPLATYICLSVRAFSISVGGHFRTFYSLNIVYLWRISPPFMCLPIAILNIPVTGDCRPCNSVNDFQLYKIRLYKISSLDEWKLLCSFL